MGIAADLSKPLLSPISVLVITFDVKILVFLFRLVHLDFVLHLIVSVFLLI